jgi:hypothetical protein
MSASTDFAYLADLDESVKLPDEADNPHESIVRLRHILLAHVQDEETREVALALLKHIESYTGL